jgi:uncharacterized protein
MALCSTNQHSKFLKPYLWHNMQAPHKFILRNQTLWLSGEKCIYWEEQQLLILSDLHLGKTGHFRKEGIGVPQNLFKEDLQRLGALLQFFKPQQLLVVGDLFHSYANKEHDYFEKWRSDFAATGITLVMGNHDVLEQDFYRRSGITIAGLQHRVNDFLFTHDMADAAAGNHYTFSGHIHPGVRLKGAGKQAMQLPCFYFGETYAVLPAFGKFTGNKLIVPEKNATIFAIAQDRIFRL